MAAPTERGGLSAGSVIRQDVTARLRWRAIGRKVNGAIEGPAGPECGETIGTLEGPRLRDGDVVGAQEG